MKGSNKTRGVGTYFGTKTALVIESDPLVVAVSKRHLLFIIPDECRVVFLQKIAHLRATKTNRMKKEMRRGVSTIWKRRVARAQKKKERKMARKS